MGLRTEIRLTFVEAGRLKVTNLVQDLNILCSALSAELNQKRARDNHFNTNPLKQCRLAIKIRKMQLVLG